VTADENVAVFTCQSDTEAHHNQQQGAPAQSYDQVSTGDVSSVLQFETLLPLPKRERVPLSRPRQKPPSYELTSNDTMEFVYEAAKKQKKKKKISGLPMTSADKSESPKKKRNMTK